MVFQHGFVAIIPVVGPGHDHITGSPGWTAATAAEGYCMGYIASLVIPCILHIEKPFPVEIGQVKIEEGRFDRHLPVAGVSQALAVRTVAADASVQVLQLRPQIVVIYFVEERIRTFKMTC